MWFKNTPLENFFRGFKIFTVQFGYGLSVISAAIGLATMPYGLLLVVNSIIYWMCAKSISQSLELEAIRRHRAEE